MTMTTHPEHIVPDDYHVDEYGVWRKLGEKRPPLRLTTTAAYVTALLRDVNGSDWSVEIAFTNPDGQACSLLVPYTQILARRDLSQLSTAAGLFVLPRGEGEYAEYIAQCAGNPELPRHRLTPKLGLNLLPDAAVPDRLAFVLPDQTLLPIAETVPLPTERLVSARCSRRRLSQPTPVPVRWRKAKNCWRWFGTIPSPSSCSAHRWRHPSWRWPVSTRSLCTSTANPPWAKRLASNWSPCFGASRWTRRPPATMSP